MNYRNLTKVSSVLLMLLVATPTYAESWVVHNSDGSKFTTDRANHRGYRMITRSWKGWTGKKLSRTRANQLQYDDFVKEIAIEKNIPAALIHAVILTESAYKPNAVSPMGATGLMQLMPATAERYGVKDRTDPEQNIRGGVSYLSDLIVMFDNDISLVLAAYNAGENAVKKYGNKIPPYKETQNYVKKVLDHYYTKRPVAKILHVSS